jgi:hypothetical protein
MSSTFADISGRKKETIDKAVIRFCGDSGDGMQITGSQFTNTVALYGNDLATLPDFPAEIRAPAGTLPGVSGFQVHFSSSDVYTPGDSVDALISIASRKPIFVRPRSFRTLSKIIRSMAIASLPWNSPN